MQMVYMFLGLSVLLNLVFLGLIFYLKFKRSKKVESYEVKQLLNDLTRGNALIEVSCKRVDAADLFIRGSR